MVNTPLAISWGPWEILAVLLVLLLLFGSSKLPKLARGLGSSVTEFRKGLRGESDDDEDKKKLPDSSNGGDEDEAKSSG
jgi:sec-independent protein translocase protein TatA